MHEENLRLELLLKKIDIKERNYKNCVIMGYMLHSKISSFTFEGCILRGFTFEGSSLKDVTFENCILDSVDLDVENAENVKIKSSIMYDTFVNKDIILEDIKYVEGYYPIPKEKDKE